MVMTGSALQKLLCIPIFIGKNALSELLGHNIWRVGVWNYFY